MSKPVPVQIVDFDAIRSNRGMRPSWTMDWRVYGHGQRSGRRLGVIKEIGTNEHLWECRCETPGHLAIRDALACARDRIAREEAG